MLAHFMNNSSLDKALLQVFRAALEQFLKNFESKPRFFGIVSHNVDCVSLGSDGWDYEVIVDLEEFYKVLSEVNLCQEVVVCSIIEG